MTAALVAVLADEHPERDAWVDEQARAVPFDLGAPISTATYMGVWIVPDGATVHLFARREDVIAILRHGARYVRG